MVKNHMIKLKNASKNYYLTNKQLDDYINQRLENFI